MSEKLRNHRNINILLATAAVISLAGSNNTNNSSKETGKHPIEQINQAADAESYAESMQITLGEGKPAQGVTMLLHNEFDINPEAQDKLSIDKIYTPMIMGGGKYGYADVDKSTGKVSIHLIDVEDGKLIQNDTTGKFAPFVGEIQVQTPFDGDGKVLAITDPLQMPVGQPVPHTEG